MFSGLDFDFFSASDWGSALDTFGTSTQGVLSAFQPVLKVGIDAANTIAQAKKAVSAIKSSSKDLPSSSSSIVSSTPSPLQPVMVQQPSNLSGIGLIAVIALGAILLIKRR